MPADLVRWSSAADSRVPPPAQRLVMLAKRKTPPRLLPAPRRHARPVPRRATRSPWACAWEGCHWPLPARRQRPPSEGFHRQPVPGVMARPRGPPARFQRPRRAPGRRLIRQPAASRCSHCTRSHRRQRTIRWIAGLRPRPTVSTSARRGAPSRRDRAPVALPCRRAIDQPIRLNQPTRPRTRCRSTPAGPCRPCPAAAAANHAQGRQPARLVRALRDPRQPLQRRRVKIAPRPDRRSHRPPRHRTRPWSETRPASWTPAGE